MSIDPPYYWGPPDPRAVVDPEIGQTVDFIPPALKPSLPSYDDDSMSDNELKSTTCHSVLSKIFDDYDSPSSSSSSSSSSHVASTTSSRIYDEWIGVAGEDSPPSNQQSHSHESTLHRPGLYDESWAPSAFLAARVRALLLHLHRDRCLSSLIVNIIGFFPALFFPSSAVIFFEGFARFVCCCGVTDPCLKWWISP